MSVHFEYSLRDKNNEYKTLKKHTYSSAEECRAFLTASYLQMTKEEQESAMDDYKLVIEMVTNNHEESITDLNIKEGQPFAMPFDFESDTLCHWVDIVISVPPIVPDEAKETVLTDDPNIIYDYRATSVTNENDVIQRYFFDNVYDLRTHITDIFTELSPEEQKAAEDDFIIMDKNIESEHFKKLIEQLKRKLDFGEIYSIPFQFSGNNEIHRLDVLVRGDEVIRWA